MLVFFISIGNIALLFFAFYKYLKIKTHVKNIERELNKLKEEYYAIIGDSEKTHNESVAPHFIDSLTGLPEYKVFEDRLSQALNQSQRQSSLFSVMALEINELSGFDYIEKITRDKFLKEVSSRLQMSIRQIDTIARFTASYFLFLLPQLPRPETAIYVAQRIQDSLLQSFKIDDRELLVAANIGIVVYPADGSDMTTLLKNADIAMRQAKCISNSKYQFYQSALHESSQRELTIASLIRSDACFQHLRIHYKSYINSDTNQPDYIQAIPFIEAPLIGKIDSKNFHNIAENSGKILGIYEWLLKNSVKQFQKWHHDGDFKPTRLAIAVSLQQLMNPHLIYGIMEIVNELNTHAIRLVLEITDDRMTQNSLCLEKLFLKLKEAHIETAIGIVSLSHFAIQKMNKILLNYLKIDSTFIQNAATDKRKEDILCKMIELSRSEEIIIMADGVDNEKLKLRLRKIGFDMLEGKVFDHLIPA